MAKTENAKKFSLIAAICYTIIALNSLYLNIKRIIYVLNSDYATINVWSVIFLLVNLGMAVALFMKNKKAVVVPMGIEALYDAYYVISYFTLINFCGFAVSAGVVVLIAFSIKGNSAVKKIWFIPALAYLINFVIGGITSYQFITWNYILFGLVEIVALLFVGMWIKEDTTPAEAAPVNEYATFNPQSVYSTTAVSSAIGGADKLKMYKDLLDSGTITQEEFDAKKKEILDL